MTPFVQREVPGEGGDRPCPRDATTLVAATRPARLTGLLAALAPSAVEVDQCPSCRGVFLDAGEISLLSGDPSLGGALTAARGRPLTGATCPACAARMSLGVFRGVEVDTCPSCGGVWLDAGETSRVARR